MENHGENGVIRLEGINIREKMNRIFVDFGLVVSLSYVGLFWGAG